MKFSEAVATIRATLGDDAKSLLTNIDLTEGRIRLYHEVDRTVNPPVMTIIYAADPGTTELPVDEYGFVTQTVKGIRNDIDVGLGAIVIDEALVYVEECVLSMEIVDTALNEMLAHFENANELAQQFKSSRSTVDDTEIHSTDNHRHDSHESYDYSDSGSSSSSD